MSQPIWAPTAIRVLVVDDDALARRAVKGILRDAGLTVIAEAENGRDAIDLARHYDPDVVLMDVTMPVVDGVTATAELLRACPGQRVVLMSSSPDDETALAGLRSGAVGFLDKAIDLDALPRAVAGVVHGGEAAISRRLTSLLLTHLQSTREDTRGLRPIHSSLSTREWEVLDLLCSGASTDHVADTLVVSLETARSHIKNILRKLGVSSRRDAVVLAAQLREQQPALSLVA